MAKLYINKTKYSNLLSTIGLNTKDVNIAKSNIKDLNIALFSNNNYNFSRKNPSK